MNHSIDNRLLVVKCITLLFRESLVPNKSEGSADLVRTALDEIKLPEVSLGVGHDREGLAALKDTALYLCGLPLNTPIDKDELMQRLKVNCTHDEKLYEALEQGIDKDMDSAKTTRTILDIQKYINDVFRESKLIKLVHSASVDLSFNRPKIKSIQKFVAELASKLEPYQIESNRKDPAIVDEVDLGDESDLSEVFEKVQDDANNTTVLKLGWKGINRMFQGGWRRGEMGVIGALQHSYKTGFSLTAFKGLTVYNTPSMLDPTKKPLMLRISFEDNIKSNVQFLYQNFYENEFKTAANIKDVTPRQMAAYVKQKMQASGFHVKMMRVNPSEWTYKDIQNYVLAREAQGYEIHVLMLDYLPMIPTTGCESGPAGHDLRDMYRRMRNFCSQRGILCVTPHQLSTDAKNIRRESNRGLVQKIANGGYYSGSKQIDQEVDWELYLNIELDQQKRAFLTCQRGKHRIPTIIPETHKYCVLPFPPKGSIPDDYHLPEGEEITLKVVGGGALGSGEEEPYWSYPEAQAEPA